MNKALVTLPVMLFSLGLCAQTADIHVSTERTLSITFPVSVSHIDLGSTSINARLVGPGSRIVLVKGVERDFEKTNLTVVTTNNEVYTFNVAFTEAPMQDAITVGEKTAAPAQYAATILDNGRRLLGVNDASGGVYGQLRGIYVRDSIVYLHLKLDNATAIGYEVAAIRFVLLNKQGIKRKAQQEITLTPISFHGNNQKVAPHGNTTFVSVLPKFSLAGRRRLQIQILERSGERNLELTVPARQLSKAVSLPSL